MQKAIPQTQAMNAGCNVVVVSRRSDIHMSELTALIDKVERFTETFNKKFADILMSEQPCEPSPCNKAPDNFPSTIYFQELKDRTNSLNGKINYLFSLLDRVEF